ncbi:4-hydroxy-tetrahydrodipicolinate synthase [Marivirga sp. S37H4]|uniref:4-hydroxy-tetrahydrodipicolinate synthase n=1 Tax=Marivirga aurantiaca TaxID=2802615 RepID=A0A934WWF3_9BACT|nr:4-hydroxy-tetrahydrodipicolinate synthase [Marivirga aurantiaca]MBK6264135.1 4-hydroxy-tetrahydrodipicolinate synthase [Marivirga aurantiaca]
MKELFKGVGPALVTPFKKDLSIDFEALENLLIHTAKGGADYWVVQGTTGESATTSFEEKKVILDFIKEHNPNNLPIVYGMGGNSTKSVIESFKAVKFKGVSAILSASPHYNKPTQDGIFQHFRSIADVSPVPVILYNVPGRTASNINAETTIRLARHPNIIGIKEASGNMEQCMRIAYEKPNDFLLISGDDLLTSSLIALGAVGVISVMANAFPRTFSRINNAALANDFPAVRKDLFRLLTLNSLMYEESNPVGVKEVLKQLGICKNHVRLPLLPASDELSKKIQTALLGKSLD